MKKELSLILLTIPLVLFPSISLGFIFQETYSLIPIIAKSDLIVVGEVARKETKWSEGKGSVIMTYITISVEEYIKGSSPSSEIVLRCPGGEIKEDNIGLMVSSFPREKGKGHINAQTLVGSRTLRCH